MLLETIVSSSIIIFIIIIKSCHDYLHSKNSNSQLHKKLDDVIDIIDIAQKTLLTQSQNNIINDVINIEEKLLNDNVDNDKNKK